MKRLNLESIKKRIKKAQKKIKKLLSKKRNQRRIYVIASLLLVSGISAGLFLNNVKDNRQKVRLLKQVEAKQIEVQHKESTINQKQQTLQEVERKKSEEIQKKDVEIKNLNEQLQSKRASQVQYAVAKRTSQNIAVPVSNPVNKSRKLGKGAYGPNTYACQPIFNCTCYAKMKRPDLPSTLGNADTWASRARALGWAVGSVAMAGAIGQSGMHVVYIESVNTKGTANPGDDVVYLSERNYDYHGSFRYRYAPAYQFVYIY